MAKIKQANIQKERRLSYEMARAVNKKIRKVLPVEMPGERKLFVAVLEAAIFDTSAIANSVRRAAWFFLLHCPADLERVCDLAEVEPDYVLRLINTVIKYERRKEVEALAS